MGVQRHPLCDEETLRQMADVPADEAVIGRLEQSFALLQTHGTGLAQRFYHRLFADAPAVRALFPDDMRAQQKKLVATLAAVIAGLRAPASLFPVLKELGVRHNDYGTRPEHYPIVVENLVAAMGELLGDAWTRELEQDWRTALTRIGQIMEAAAAAARGVATTALAR